MRWSSQSTQSLHLLLPFPPFLNSFSFSSLSLSRITFPNTGVSHESLPQTLLCRDPRLRHSWDVLGGRVIGICFPVQEVWVQSLVMELGSYMPCSQKYKNINNRSQHCNKFNKDFNKRHSLTITMTFITNPLCITSLEFF